MEKNIKKVKKVRVKKGKHKIPAALREQVWIKYMGEIFKGKCSTLWCNNVITVFDFQSGHNIPESKGGSTTIDNLVPICSRCNQSMGNNYTFDDWCSQYKNRKRKGFWSRFFSCF
jgi:5-methylcytosine-specific restriction endonuclease McrA